ncbi:MAG: hypothetical protein AAF456_10910 [Planctomycetota bacterium]
MDLKSLIVSDGEIRKLVMTSASVELEFIDYCESRLRICFSGVREANVDHDSIGCRLEDLQIDRSSEKTTIRFLDEDGACAELILDASFEYTIDLLDD